MVYPHLLDVGCFAHTLDHVGEKFSTPILREFISLWVSLFSHSPKWRLIWKTQTGRAMQSFSKTRWWSQWEVMHQVMVQYGNVEGFLRKDDVSSITSSKLLDIVCDVRKKLTLQLELATVIDIGIHFVKATYELEGDGPLILSCFEIIERVRMAIQSAHYPNINAIACNLSSSNPVLQQQYTAYAVNCLHPGIAYFNTAFQSKLQRCSGISPTHISPTTIIHPDSRPVMPTCIHARATDLSAFVHRTTFSATVDLQAATFR